MMAATAWPGRYAPGFEARGGPVPPSASLGYDPCPAVNCYPLCSPPPKSPDRCAPPNQRCSCSPPPNRPDRSAPPAGQTHSAAAAPRLRGARRSCSTIRKFRLRSLPNRQSGRSNNPRASSAGAPRGWLSGPPSTDGCSMARRSDSCRNNIASGRTRAR
jgi:hypothetical protein